MTAPRRVAVLGGGPAGLAAAWELTQPEHEGRFTVTVHTMGWRLGGKGASAVDPTRNHRITEHGLHVWFGFYAESERLLSESYAELGDDAPYADPQDALVPIRRLGLWDRKAQWHVPVPLPASTPSKNVLGAAARLYADVVREFWRPNESWVPAAVEELAERGPPKTDAERDEQLALLAQGRDELLADESAVLADPRAAATIGDPAAAGFRDRVKKVMALRRFGAALLDLWWALMGGLIAKGALVLPGRWNSSALEELDEVEWRTFLREYHASEDTLSSALVTALYDLPFAYVEGDKPEIAAGVASRVVFRLAFEHGGRFASYLNGGMGDVYVAPLYRALLKRGVRFAFFRAITGLTPAPGEDRIATIEYVDQARPKGPGYDPLAHGAWPPEPNWGQLVDGEALRLSEVDFEREMPAARAKRETLHRGKDFDDVVLAIPVGALTDHQIARDLESADLRFANMLEQSDTVATQALQLWLSSPADDDQVPTAPKRGALTGGAPKPFDTLADLHHLIGHERWPPNSVQQIAYLCSVLKLQPGTPPDTQVKANAATAVRRLGVGGLLVGPDGKPGKLEHQYWRANHAGSERYALSRPGRIAARLGPDATPWTNLALAGDWVKNDINAGCFEAAVRTGTEAGRCLARPRYVEFGGVRSAPPPVISEDGDIYWFFVGADPDRIAALCRRVFSEPTGGRLRVRPLMPYVGLSFGVMDVRVEVPPYDEMGRISERHAAIWIPVACEGLDGVPPLAAFQSLLWVDNPMSIAVGHDIYGYPKNQGWIGLDRAESGPRPKGVPPVTSFELSAYAFGRMPDAPERRPLLHVKPRSPQQPVGEPIDVTGLATVTDLLGDLWRESPGWLDRLVGLLSGHASVAVPNIFLRQFRSPTGGRAASSQEVVTAVTEVVPGTAKLQRLGPHVVTLRDLASEGLFRDLGLGADPARSPAVQEMTLTAERAFRVQMDFRLLPGRVLWAQHER